MAGCQLNMIVDCGASVNIVDKQPWQWIKENRGYTGGNWNIQLLNLCWSSCVGCISLCISGQEESLLGQDTSMKLGVLKLGVDVASVKSGLQDVGEMIQRMYAEVCKGVGKLKKSVSTTKPISQPV